MKRILKTSVYLFGICALGLVQSQNLPSGFAASGTMEYEMSPGHAASLGAGLFLEGRYGLAFDMWKVASKSDDSIAQFGLALLSMQGLGVARNYKEAAKWFLLSARHGNSAAQSSLGFLYQEGLGVNKDQKESDKWYRLAAQRRDDTAYKDSTVQLLFGALYLLDEK